MSAHQDDKPSNEPTPRRVTIQPATEHDQAMPIRATKLATIQPALEHDEAMPITASKVIQGTATAIVGPSPPQPTTTGEAAGVLGLVVSGLGVGFEVGHAIGGLPGGMIGGAAGGAVSVGTLRWQPAREATFRFIRSLTGD